jgi:hypothetical protein
MGSGPLFYLFEFVSESVEEISFQKGDRNMSATTPTTTESGRTKAVPEEIGKRKQRWVRRENVDRKPNDKQEPPAESKDMPPLPRPDERGEFWTSYQSY